MNDPPKPRWVCTPCQAEFPHMKEWLAHRGTSVYKIEVARRKINYILDVLEQDLHGKVEKE